MTDKKRRTLADVLSDDEKILTVEEMLALWVSQDPTRLRVLPNELQFIADMRKAANGDLGVGYGWMQQVIEWEWRVVLKEKHGLTVGALGPIAITKLIDELGAKDRELDAKDKEIEQLKGQIASMQRTMSQALNEGDGTYKP